MTAVQASAQRRRAPGQPRFHYGDHGQRDQWLSESRSLRDNKVILPADGACVTIAGRTTALVKPN